MALLQMSSVEEAVHALMVGLLFNNTEISYNFLSSQYSTKYNQDCSIVSTYIPI